jgi:hypothetical protein
MIASSSLVRNPGLDAYQHPSYLPAELKVAATHQ